MHDVSFDVAAGELVALIGPNGAGKTTCFNLINGQLAPDSGDAHYARAENLYRCHLDYAGAQAELAIVQKSLPNDPRVYLLRGFIDRRQGRDEEGLRNMAQALKFDPRNLYTLHQISLSYEMLHKYADYAQTLERALAIAPDDLDTKAEVFRQADETLPPRAVLASNTSSIPITSLAGATDRPERVIGMHFFNPVPVLPLVELVGTLVTTDAAIARTEQFASSVLGKQVVRCSDRSGFVVNALLVPYLLSAIRMVEAGVATVDDVDKAVVAGLSHPMGPLALADMIGLDTIEAVADSMYAEFKEPLYAPPPLLSRMVEAGLLGRKVGRGFFNYTK